MLMIIIAMACLGAAVFLVGEVVTLGARQRASSIKRAASYGRPRSVEFPGQESFHERVVDPLRGSLAGLVLRLSPKTTLESVSLKLFAAGLGRGVSPVGFLALKAMLAFGGVVGGAALGGTSSGARAGFFLAAILGVAGYLTPEIFVTMRARSRKDRIRRDLPDSLDLLAVSVEAGLGFDAAIVKLIERFRGPLADEFELALGEMRIGESRENALKKLAERVGVPDVGGFVRAMIQADQLGMSIGRILRVQAADSRLKRQAAAEERAMKAPIKMLFPTVLFIFPAMFIVILGPAMLTLLKLF